MDIRPIRTDADHVAALKEIERLWGAKSGSRNGDKLEVLGHRCRAESSRGRSSRQIPSRP